MGNGKIEYYDLNTDEKREKLTSEFGASEFNKLHRIGLILLPLLGVESGCWNCS